MNIKLNQLQAINNGRRAAMNIKLRKLSLQLASQRRTPNSDLSRSPKLALVPLKEIENEYEATQDDSHLIRCP